MSGQIYKAALAVMLLAFALGAAADQSGQEASKQATTKVESAQIMRVQKPPVVVPAGAGQLSRALQNALEKGDPVRVEGSGGRLVAAPGTAGYTCNGGNCACAGAADCVDMITVDKKCNEDTIGCNDYGCTCKEGDGG